MKTAILCFACACALAQPAEPVDPSPIDGETYYVVNQLSGMQLDLDGSRVVQQPRSFSSLSQRWAFASLAGGFWQITNIRSGLCLDGADIYIDLPVRSKSAKPARAPVAQKPCAGSNTQQWTLHPTSNAYYTIANRSTGLLLDLSRRSASAGALLLQTAPASAPAQSQQWLLRPAFFRGIDNALLEKQEAARVALGIAWWNDAGQQQDLLQILKNHGVNMVRLRPSSVPPYANISQPGCSGNACYGETDAQDLDLAKRARNLGLSLELTLLFDGGASASIPPAWSADTELTELQSDVYAYVKSELLAYRQAGAMPDLVSIGNEVDTGFLGAIGSPTGQNFQGFATLQIAAMQAVADAAADTSAGSPIPPPLTCIHITPAWDLTQFFTLVNQFKIPFDAICHSYYPIYHGPLTAAQAASSNPGGKPVEQQVLINAANTIAKPIFIIETGEHYENGFDANDPWYTPPSQALQRQFLLDLQAVEEGLPNNLGMGMEYWDPAGVMLPGASGIYTWNGLTLFDESSTLLPGVDALGGKLDPTLSYRFVNRGNGQPIGTPWRIASNDDGYFQIAGAADASILLGGTAAEWNIVSAANGYFYFVDRASGMVLDVSGALVPNTGATAQQWQIVAVWSPR
jgi:arabinogalactan endo-1,4-beta-galactosidase